MIETTRSDAEMLVRGLVMLYSEGAVNEGEEPQLRAIVERIDAEHKGLLRELYEGFLPCVLDVEPLRTLGAE